MAELMSMADLAIGAAGAASWERCCLGLPCIVGAVALNQMQAAKDLSVFGATRFIGAGQEITVDNLKQGIEQACDQDWLKYSSLVGLGLVDGQGVMRVISIMEKCMAEDILPGH
jgi:spore coat polysaccharide biosynthesis predicted glycosyltransferase SpsG